MPQAIQPVQAAPLNPSQAVPVPARALPPQPLASSSSLQSLSSNKGCLQRFFEYISSIAESIFSYCFCHRSSNPPAVVQPHVNPNPPVAARAPVIPNPLPIPAANNPMQNPPPAALGGSPSVQGLGQPSQDIPVQPVLDANQINEVADVEESDQEGDGRLGLASSQEILLELYRDLDPARLQELVMTERWEQIQNDARLVSEWLQNSSLEHQVMGATLEHLDAIIKAAHEWKRFLDNEEEVEPYRGNIENLRREDIPRQLRELLSRARFELRKPPAEIDREFVNRLDDLIEEDPGEEIMPLLDTLKAVRGLLDAHVRGFFQRGVDLDIFTPLRNRLNHLMQQLSPDRIEGFVNNPDWETFETELREGVNGLLDHQRTEFCVLHADKIDFVLFMNQVAGVWGQHLRNPSNVPPYRGDFAEDVGDLTLDQREDLLKGLLSAIKEQVMTPPDQINLERVQMIGDLATVLSELRWNRELDSIFEMIKLAKGLVELHSEDYFQRIPPIQNAG